MLNVAFVLFAVQILVSCSPIDTQTSASVKIPLSKRSPVADSDGTVLGGVLRSMLENILL